MTSTVTDAVTVGGSHTSPTRPDPYVSYSYPANRPSLRWDGLARTDRLARRIAEVQLDRLDELSLIGYPTGFDEVTRDVVREALRLAARGVLER